MKEQDHLTLLNEELNIVYRYLMKLGIRHEDAQDIVQETAYKYLLYYDSIKTPHIRSWLIRVALNYHHDQYKKQKRIKLGLEDEEIKLLSKDLPEELLLSSETWNDIENVLSKLKPQYKEIILLKYLWRFKYEEISSLLDMKVSTIKTSLFRARKQFVKIYRRLNNE